MRARRVLTVLIAVAAVAALAGCGTADDTTVTAPGSSAPPGTAKGPGVVDPTSSTSSSTPSSPSSTTSQPAGSELSPVVEVAATFEQLLDGARTDPSASAPIAWDGELMARCGPTDAVLDGLTLFGRVELAGDADRPDNEVSRFVAALEDAGATVERSDGRITASAERWTVRFDQALIQIYPPQWSVEIRATVAEEPFPFGFQRGRTFCG